MPQYEGKHIKVKILGLCMAFVFMAACNKEEPKKDPLPSNILQISEKPEPTDSTVDSGSSGENIQDKEEISDSVPYKTAAEILDYFREKTISYAGEMLAGDFSVCDEFSGEIKEILSEREMKSAWKQAVQGLGDPVSDERIAESSFLNFSVSGDTEGSIEDFGGYVVTNVQIPYQTKIVILSVTYDSAGAVAGIYLTYTLPETAPEQTEEYKEYEVSIGEKNYPLSGLLTLPNGIENPPVVLLVHGSGQSDKNETIGAAGNTPFADIAQALAKKGIASLRYNKRYYQYPELAADNITIQDEVLDDVAAAIKFLEEQEIDKSRIYVLGHSLGGMLAPYIAEKNPKIAGMISLAGSPRGLWEIVYDQNIAAIEMAKLGEAEEQNLRQMLQEEYEKVLSLVADVRGGAADIDKERLSEALFGVSGYYWASLAEIDSANAAKDLEIPILILQGDADFQVYPDRDYAAWQVLLEGKSNVTFKLFEGLNHLFMLSDGTMNVTEYDTKAQVAPEVIDTIAAWMDGEEEEP
jgi:hypothetical protein